MQKRLISGFLGAAALLGLAGIVTAQVVAPQVSGIGNTDLIPDIVGGQPTAGTTYASGASVLAYVNSQPSRGNAIIGGDGTTNLWQRGTAGVSSTSATVQWSSADRWGQWTLSSGGVKIVQDTTAADLPVSYKSAIALTHTATTAGAICMGQSIESVNAYQFQGQTVELDFHAATGSGYTGTNTLTAYITYGTGADQGLNYAAYTMNAGGATGYTGGANATVAVIPLTAVSTIGRFAAVASIPATATEISIGFCYTPTIADTNDYVAFSGIQLVRAPQLSKYVSATVGYETDNVTVPALFQATAFERRLQAIETVLQQRYFYQINEPAASKIVSQGGAYETATICDVVVKLPVTMFKAPVLTLTGGSASTWAVMSKSTTPVVLASTWLIQDAVIGNTVDSIALQATTASTTAGFACELVGAGGGASIAALAED